MIGDKWNVLWVVGGDFNVVRYQDDRRRGDGIIIERVRFNDTIQQLNRMKILVLDRKYTWSSL